MLSANYQNIKAKPSRCLFIAPMFKDIDMEECEVVYNGTVKLYNMPINLESLKERIRKHGHFLGLTPDPKVFCIVLKTGQEYMTIVSEESLAIII